MTQLSVGDKVRRNTPELRYAVEVGEIIEIDSEAGRAHIKWEDKRTWYKLANLLTA